MNYRDYLANAVLGDAAKERIRASLAQNKERRVACGSFTGRRLAAVALSVILLSAVAVPVGITAAKGGGRTPISGGEPSTGVIQNGSTGETGFGGGAIGAQNGAQDGVESEPQLFSYLYCGYLFEKNVFPKSDVRATLLFGIGEKDFEIAYRDPDLEMERFTLVAGVINEDIRERDSGLWEETVGQYRDGVQIFHKKTFPSYREVDLSEYALKLKTEESGEGIVCGNTTYKVFYTKKLDVTVPEELFIGKKGRIDFFFLNEIEYADGSEETMWQTYNSGPPCFFYSVEGENVRLSKSQI